MGGESATAGNVESDTTSYTTTAWVRADPATTILVSWSCDRRGTAHVEWTTLLRNNDAGARPIALAGLDWRSIGEYRGACPCARVEAPPVLDGGGLPAPPLSALALTAALLVVAALLRRRSSPAWVEAQLRGLREIE